MAMRQDQMERLRVMKEQPAAFQEMLGRVRESLGVPIVGAGWAAGSRMIMPGTTPRVSPECADGETEVACDVTQCRCWSPCASPCASYRAGACGSPVDLQLTLRVLCAMRCVHHRGVFLVLLCPGVHPRGVCSGWAHCIMALIAPLTCVPAGRGRAGVGCGPDAGHCKGHCCSHPGSLGQGHQ